MTISEYKVTIVCYKDINSQFFCPNCMFISRKSDFIARNCYFISGNSEK